MARLVKFVLKYVLLIVLKIKLILEVNRCLLRLLQLHQSRPSVLKTGREINRARLIFNGPSPRVDRHVAHLFLIWHVLIKSCIARSGSSYKAATFVLIGATTIGSNGHLLLVRCVIIFFAVLPLECLIILPDLIYAALLDFLQNSSPINSPLDTRGLLAILTLLNFLGVHGTIIWAPTLGEWRRTGLHLVRLIIGLQARAPLIDLVESAFKGSIGRHLLLLFIRLWLESAHSCEVKLSRVFLVDGNSIYRVVNFDVWGALLVGRNGVTVLIAGDSSAVHLSKALSGVQDIHGHRMLMVILGSLLGLRNPPVYRAFLAVLKVYELGFYH